MNRAAARACLTALLACSPLPLFAQSASNVLVVVNDRSPDSRLVAEHYVAKRGVPAEQVVHVDAAPVERIARRDYLIEIETPIRTWIASHDAQDRILYIVLTKGVPLVISGTSGPAGTMASVDSELTLLYRRMTGAVSSIDGSVDNPYFATSESPFVPFSHAAYDIYLVTRLDGFTARDAMALVDRSITASREGSIIVARRATSQPTAVDEWVGATVDRLKEIGVGDRVAVWRTTSGSPPDGRALGYISWSSNDPATAARRPPVTFAPGALAATFLSADARTMTEPPADWRPSPVGIPYAGSSQALVGDLIRAGVTGTAGQVSEPYLAGTVRPYRLFPGYLSGLNLAEAFYRAIPSLSWQTVVIGDPLCAPFRKQDLTAADAAPPLDTQTELPVFFSRRRVAQIGGAAQWAAFQVRAEGRLAKGDRAGGAAALDQAITAGANTAGVWRAVAQLRDESHQYPEAADAYEHVIAIAPDDLISLNNLAYLRAVRLHDPAAARPMAERALKLSNGSPTVADTLGWIKHLLGDDAGALPLIESARVALPDNAEVQLHAAVLYAAAGRMDESRAALKAAAAADPTIATRDDYVAVQRKLSGGF